MKSTALTLFFLFSFVGAFPAQDSREFFKFAMFKYNNKEYKESLDFLDKALEKDSLYVNARYLRAEVYYELGHYLSAVADIDCLFEVEKIITAYTGKYYLARGKSFLALGELLKASYDIEKAYELSGNNDEVYYYKAALGLEEKTYKIALEDLETAIRIRSNNPAYYALRAEIKINYYKPERGSNVYYSILEDMNAAITLSPANHTYYMVRSKFLVAMEEVDEAIDDYDQIIKLFPNNEQAYIERGVIKMNDSKYESAFEDFTTAIKINPNSERSFRFRGLCRHNLNNFYGANKDFSKSIDLLTGNFLNGNLIPEKKEKVKKLLAESYVLRGHCLNSSGKNGLACQDFLRAYHLGIKKGLNYYRRYCSIY